MKLKARSKASIEFLTKVMAMEEMRGSGWVTT